MSRVYHVRTAMYVQRADVVTLYPSALVSMREVRDANGVAYSYADVLWRSLRMRDETGSAWGRGDLTADEREDLETLLADDAHGQHGEHVRRQRARDAAAAAQPSLEVPLAGSVAVARARNVARGVVAEMAVTTGTEDEDAA